MKEKLRDMEDRMKGFNICQTGFLQENNENRKEAIFVEIMTENFPKFILYVKES